MAKAKKRTAVRTAQKVKRQRAGKAVVRVDAEGQMWITLHEIRDRCDSLGVQVNGMQNLLAKQQDMYPVVQSSMAVASRRIEAAEQRIAAADLSQYAEGMGALYRGVEDVLHALQAAAAKLNQNAATDRDLASLRFERDAALADAAKQKIRADRAVALNAAAAPPAGLALRHPIDDLQFKEAPPGPHRYELQTARIAELEAERAALLARGARDELCDVTTEMDEALQDASRWKPVTDSLPGAIEVTKRYVLVGAALLQQLKAFATQAIVDGRDTVEVSAAAVACMAGEILRGREHVDFAKVLKEATS